ncbi:MAG: hypothetical protein KAH23_06840 [Kiritimatiellae bacterium]|nr:hypothetical protein [Kiritimatiellia bacterium]
MAKDFFDDDMLLTNNAHRGGAEEMDGVPVSPITEVSIGKMVKQKEDLSNQVAGAVGELDRLRKRQERLEKEKNDLEDLTRKQNEYEQGKRDVMEKLCRGLVAVEKEHAQALRMVELLSETQARFNDAFSELDEIDEDSWPDDEFQMELNRALVRVDIANDMYRKALARIDSASWHKKAPKKKRSDLFVEAERELKVKMGFGFWLVAGLAASLPLILVMVLLFAIWLIFNFTGMWQM